MATELEPDAKVVGAAGTEVEVKEVAGAGEEPIAVITGGENRFLATVLRFIPLLLLVLIMLYFGQNLAYSRKWLSIGTDAMLFGVVALGVNILLGYTGLLSLGHAAFFVIGGYAGAVFAPEIGFPAWLGFLPAAVV